MQNVMIDLETMGLRPNAAIVSIGAVHFDSSLTISTFHQPILLASCEAAGLTVDQSTADWWAKQSKEARASWDNDQAVDLAEALDRFRGWINLIGGVKDVAPWGNGADFDLVLLKSAFDAVDMAVPWRYYNHRCFRTVRNLLPLEVPIQRVGTHHNALDDALYQTQWLQAVIKAYEIELT